MDDKEIILNTAQDASHLRGRIEANKGQQVDLNRWIFNHLHVPDNFKIFELCCGTGAQTAYLAQRVGPEGHIYALDISSEALENVNRSLGKKYRNKLATLEADLDDFSNHLSSQGLFPPVFDLIFCSYGLYYCTDIQKTLTDIGRWLKPDGKLAIVGPFGPNNKPLYDVLRKNSVLLSDYVLHTNSTFMTLDVLPWAAEFFELVSVHTLVNPIVWDSADMFMAYWKNTTFYDETKRDFVRHYIDTYFQKSDTFINKKWVMLLIAEKKRHITGGNYIVV